MSQHQYAMVMDLNKCLGCQTCTMACKKQWVAQDLELTLSLSAHDESPADERTRSAHT